MAQETIIREFRKDDLGGIVELSLRAWEPVFASLRQVLGDRLFLRLHPDWEEDQAEEVRTACTDEERVVFVAVAAGRPVGFVARGRRRTGPPLFGSGRDVASRSDRNRGLTRP